MMTTQQAENLAKSIENALSIEDVLSDIIDAIRDELQPEDVFETDALTNWAENNGFAKEE